MIDTNIILIGPSGTGKTTLSRLLGEALGATAMDIDDLRWSYYAEIGYDHEHAEAFRREQGMDALVAYWKPFEIHSVERLMQDYPAGNVIAFGAGQSVYDDPAFFKRAKQALASYTVIFLLPSPDVEESVLLLNARIHRSEPNLPDEFFPVIGRWNRVFMQHPSNHSLATYIVYTKDKSPEQTRDEILRLLDLQLKC